MPSTVNGIGTWYYGKDHLATRNDRCEFCSSYEQLKSYDTTLYFVVLFIPVIPLGKKRIIDECPRCKRHRAAKLADWEKRKAELILNATQAWQQDRANKAKAIDALGTTIGFHDVESFRQLAGPIGAAFPREADVQIFLGDAYDHFGDVAAAERCYRAAIVNRPDEASNEALGKFFLRLNRPADAQPLFSHVLANKIRPRAPLLLALAEAYQSIGDHESAWRIVDDVGTAFPDLLSEPHYEKIRRSVSKHRGTNKAVRSSTKDRNEGFNQTSWLSRHMGLAIVGCVILVAGIWYLGLAFSLGKHTVSLVNGTESAYTVNINGQQINLPAMSQVPADIREGVLKISAPGSNGAIKPTTVEMRTNFWRRPWNRRTMIINPDRSAIIYQEETRYSDTLDDNYQPPQHFYAGIALYNLDKVDYVFAPFPQQLKMPDNAKAITKTRVDMARDNIEVMSALATQFPPAKAIEFLRQHLADRPIRIPFHRMYQTMVEKEQPEFDVTAEYRELLNKNPQDSTLTYLLARTIDDRDEAGALFRKATEMPTPCAFASFALSYDAMNATKFDEALRHAQQARKLEADNPMFIDAEIDALEAMGRYDEALAVIGGMKKDPAVRSSGVTLELRLLASKPDLTAARASLEKFCQEITALAGSRPEFVARVRLPLEASIHYASGDMPAWRASISGQDTPAAVFAAALDQGNIQGAQAALAKITPPNVSEHLLVYIAAMKAGKRDVAETMWNSSIDLMKKGHRSERLFAEALAGREPPSEKALHNWTTRPIERCIVLTALGLRYPQKQAEYFAIAKKLNYAKRVPARFIDQVISP